MPTSQTTPTCIALARSCTYKALAALMDTPTEALVDGIRSDAVVSGIAESVERLADEDSSYGSAVDALGYLHNALATEIESISWQTMRDGHMQFGRRSLGCPPYETEFGYGNVFQKTNAMADIAGFYNAFGVALNPDAHEQVDYLATELEFMHVLTAKQAEALETGNRSGEEMCASAQKKFLAEHLGRWIQGFADYLRKRAGDGPYSAIAAFTACFIACEMECLDCTPEPIDFEVRCKDEEIEGRAPCMTEDDSSVAQGCAQADPLCK